MLPGNYRINGLDTIPRHYHACHTVQKRWVEICPLRLFGVDIYLSVPSGKHRVPCNLLIVAAILIDAMSRKEKPEAINLTDAVRM